MNSSLQLRGFQITFNNDRPMGDLFYQQKKSIENEYCYVSLNGDVLRKPGY